MTKKTASLASIPIRRGTLEKVVERLLPQVDHLNVYLNGYTDVPSFLASPRITVARSQQYGDIGDAGKFFWAEEVEGYHFTCDDDLLYPPGYIEKMIVAIEAYHREAVVGWHGSILHPCFNNYYGRDSRSIISFSRQVRRNTPVHILGTGTVGYHTTTIHVIRKDFSIPNMADAWFGVLAQQQAVPLIVLAHAQGSLIEIPGTVHSQGIYDNSSRKSGRPSDTCTPQTELVLKHMPWSIHQAGNKLYKPVRGRQVTDAIYWDARYRGGKHSGRGSYKEEGAYKTRRIIELIKQYKVQSLVDFGVGDGHIASQILSSNVALTYTGIDFSPKALQKSQEKIVGTFLVQDLTVPLLLAEDMALCLDVTFHIPTDVKAAAILKNFSRSFRKAGVISGWNNSETAKSLPLDDHCFYRPLQLPPNLKIIQEEVLPTNPAKSLFLVERTDIRPVQGPTTLGYLCCAPDQFLYRELGPRQYYEYALLMAIRKYQRPGVYVDVGAHIGNHTVFFALECPSTKVLAIEPHPITHDELRASLTASNVNTKVIPFQLAIHPTLQEVTLQEPPLDGVTRIVPNRGCCIVQAGTGIPARKLDTLVALHRPIAVLKVDVEGMELDVLMSGLEMIKKDRPLIACEADKRRKQSIHTLLSSLGYEQRGPNLGHTPTWLWVPKELSDPN